MIGLFALAFIAGAVLTFAVAGATGAALGVRGVPAAWRLGFAGSGLLALAAVDLLAIARARYCPIGRRRQTPRALMRRHPMDVVAAVWGFDTGLAVTTFRVAALTWGALLLAILGLAPAWAGLCYGLGFVLPFLARLSNPRIVGRSPGSAPADPGFESMLGRRATIQGVSAVLLIVSGAGLLAAIAA